MNLLERFRAYLGSSSQLEAFEKMFSKENRAALTSLGDSAADMVIKLAWDLITSQNKLETMQKDLTALQTALDAVKATQTASITPATPAKSA